MAHKPETKIAKKSDYLPPDPAYTPKLNPTEIVWPLVRECLANQSFNNQGRTRGSFIQTMCVVKEIVKGVAGVGWMPTL